MQHEKLIDPYFQNKIKLDVIGEDGRLVGEVFLLDRSMLPKQSIKRQKRGKKE